MEVRFSPANLSNLLFWQVACKRNPSVFWVKPLASGSTVSAYADKGKPYEFEFFKHCPNA